MRTDTTGRYILLGLVGFFLAFALTIDYRRAAGYFFGDEAVYYMMAQSIAFDRDLEYTALDLQRVYEDGWHAGPLGVFLTKTDDGKILYAKYPAYSLFLAPFLAIFGFNGFLVLNVLLWGAMIWMGWAYLRQFNASGWSLFVAITFFLLSAGFVYTFWVTPETFNMFCITSGLFLWLYQRDTRLYHAKFSWWPLGSGLQWLLGTPQGRIYLAPIPIAIAAASKLPNILFLAPMLADILLVEFTAKGGTSFPSSRHLLSLEFDSADIRKRIRKLVFVGIITVLVLGSFYGFQYLMTGKTNAYAGDRRTFYWQFPFGSESDVWERGTRLSNEDYYEESFFFHPKTFVYNLYYYVFGRFTGMVPYFFCSFVALYYCLKRLLRRKLALFDILINWRRVFLGLAIAGSILGYILIAPSNYQGGGGAFGNRFFLNIYPAFLFLITTMTSLRPLVVGWIVGSLFLAQPLLTPFKTSFFPASHAFHLPYRFLPVERTLADTLPTNVNRHLMQTALSKGSPSYRLYFCDENLSDFTAAGFWVQGEKATELVVRTFAGQRYLVATIINGPVPNRVNIEVAGQQRSVVLTIPGEHRHLVFPLENPVPFFHDAVYPMKVQSKTGFISSFTPGTDLNDLRYLGTWVSVSFSDAEAGRIYAEQGQAAEAIDILEPLARQNPDDVPARYALGKAYQQSGNAQTAIREFEESLASLSEFQQTFIAAYNAQNPENPLAEAPESLPDLTLQNVLAPITISYEAETLLRGTGDVAHEPDASQAESMFFDADIDTPGFLVYGQNSNFPAGQYQVRVRFKTFAQELPSNDPGNPVAFYCDVYSQEYGIITQKKILLEDTDYAQYQSYTFNFEHVRSTSLEFRVKTTGAADVVIDKIEVYPLLPLQIYHALGLAKNATGDWEGAYTLLRQVVEFDQWTPAFQKDFLTLLQEQQRQEEITAFVSKQARQSEWHTGIATYVDDVGNASSSRDTWLSNFIPEHPVEYRFAETLALVGYDAFPQKVSPGSPVTIRLYWKALQEIKEHLHFSLSFMKQGTWFGSELLAKIQRKLGTPRITRFSFTYQPLEGAYQTGDWLTNEIIRDQPRFPLPPNLKPGNYDVWIEVIHPLDGQPLRDGKAQKVKLGELLIEG